MTADVNQLSGRREPPTVTPASDRLIQSAKPEESQDRSKNGHRPSTGFAGIWGTPRERAERLIIDLDDRDLAQPSRPIILVT
jgi:hypothetical protein